MDFSALTRTISSQELRAYREQPNVKKQWRPVVFSVHTIAVLVMSIALMVAWSPDGLVSFIGILAVFAPLVAIIYVLVWRNMKQSDLRAMRLGEFCAHNNMRYEHDVRDNAGHLGMIFTTGHTRKIKERIISAKGFEVGVYAFKTGSGKSEQTHTWGYLTMPLERKVPHMVLDSRKNNTSVFGIQFTNLPTSFDKDQILALEGDFNNYFTLYAPKEYERDALYIFTPDLMALLIDHTSHYDIETVDDHMFVYSLPFDLIDQTAWERLLRIVDTVGAKTLSRTDNYADERVGERAANIVAVPGRRLKTGVPAISIMIFICYVLYIILRTAGVFSDFHHVLE